MSVPSSRWVRWMISSATVTHSSPPLGNGERHGGHAMYLAANLHHGGDEMSAVSMANSMLATSRT